MGLHHGHDHGGHGPHEGHDHAPHAGHSHAPASFGMAFLVGIALNSAVVIAEVVFGILGNSTALVADAAHNLSDVLALAVAFAATVLARRAPSPRFTYGLRATSILAALFNAVLLLIVTGGVSWAAIGRLVWPQASAGTTMSIVALCALVANAVTALLFASGRKDDVNIRGAFLHMVADAGIAAGVAVGGVLIALTGWRWLDPALSLTINAVIVVGTWSLLRESVAMSLDGVPRGIDAETVRGFLTALPGVAACHDLHIWPMSTRETALTAHLMMPAGHPGDGFLMAAAADLNARYRIGHATLQIETDMETMRALAPESAV